AEERLISQFGLEKITPQIREAIGKCNFTDRNLLIAHRDLGAFLDSAKKKKPVAVLSGIKPSGSFHLGTKMTAEEMIFFQQRFGAKLFYCIADLEAYADNGLPLEKSKENALSNIADLLALGLDEKNSYIYFQSREKRVTNYAYIVAARTTRATVEAIYGEKDFGLYFAAFTQVGDILLPQHEDFGGPKNVLVPVGLDQDPHIRFSRDIAAKLGLVAPSATYHKTIKSLDGTAKMSKRDPRNIITLDDDPQAAYKKVMSTFTGGRATAEEQRRIGGDLGVCVVWDLCRFHFLGDSELEDMRTGCTTGRFLCGECKKMRAQKVSEFLEAHQDRKRHMLNRAQKIIDKAWEI
ncbi:MAG TPA: tryptophan--tRNA ligase, partial [Candidatus Micrarchaeota archaeon]|nr:tryptophan--tRNA ligase [Candidatus Micrarchaeota archaeon]